MSWGKFWEIEGNVGVLAGWLDWGVLEWHFLEGDFLGFERRYGGVCLELWIFFGFGGGERWGALVSYQHVRSFFPFEIVCRIIGSQLDARQ